MTKYSKLFKDHSWYSNLSSQFLWYSWPDSASTSWLARSAFFSLIRWNRSLTILWSSWWSKLWWWWWLWWAGRCALLFNCHNTKCSLRPHEVNLSLSLSKPILRGFEKCRIPSNLWNRRCLCQTPGISAWGSLEDSRWTWHREQSWIPGSQYDHPARQSNYVTFNISSMFFFAKYLQRNFLSYLMTFTSFVSYIRNMWRSSFSVSVPG